jgi:catechol 2,3-dioxygenase-like lactoylglutathione lyase family enzyme
MTTLHIALECSSEENADQFYLDLLGLERGELKTLPRNLSKAIFQIEDEINIINYTGPGVHFEVFIHGPGAGSGRRLEHVCLEVDSLFGTLERAVGLGFRTLQVPKGEALLSFMYDGDGNLFELKEKKKG